jgi:hypothetical protein
VRRIGCDGDHVACGAAQTALELEIPLERESRLDRVVSVRM